MMRVAGDQGLQLTYAEGLYYGILEEVGRTLMGPLGCVDIQMTLWAGTYTHQEANWLGLTLVDKCCKANSHICWGYCRLSVLLKVGAKGRTGVRKKPVGQIWNRNLEVDCNAPLAAWWTWGKHAGPPLIVQHVSLIPGLVVGTCERAWSLCRGVACGWVGANRVLETPIGANLLACLLMWSRWYPPLR